ncbi:MAG: xanthine dehydrogenase family protein molybdopterin-binding subunit [Pseudomonadota bacterium]
MKHVGRPLPRLEDRPLVTGRGRFVGDINLVHQCHMRVVRSPVALGRLRQIHVRAAAELPGVAAVWTAEDVASVGPIGAPEWSGMGLGPYCAPILAADMVRYVGEPIAVVFADSQGLAEDAAELVEADIVSLEPRLDGAASKGPSHDGRPLDMRLVKQAYGNLEEAFLTASAVVETTLRLERAGGMPLETRGIVAAWDSGRDVIEVWGPARTPHGARDTLARLLGRPQCAVAVYQGDVGGSFGARGLVGPEEVLACLAAERLQRPVRWMEDRREHSLAAGQSPAMDATARAAVAEDGALTAVDVTFTLDQGAYLTAEALTTADLIAALVPGPYRLDAFKAEGRLVATNTVPAGTVRGGGAFEAAFVRERLLDTVARTLGQDGLDVRRRNLGGSGTGRPLVVLGADVPLATADGDRLIRQAAKRFNLDLLRRRVADRRSQGGLVGLGLALGLDVTGLGSGDKAQLTVDSSGTVELLTGAAALGQGVATALAQIVADIVGVDHDKVRVVSGRTDRIGHGLGATHASATEMAGSAAQLAAETLREKILLAAAAKLGAQPERLTIQSGRIREADRHFGTAVELGQLVSSPAGGASDGGTSDDGGEAHDLTASAWFHAAHPSTPLGLHVAVVEIDGATGHMRVPRAFVAADVGSAVNPALIEGQLVGGAVHGVGRALSEAFTTAETGDPLSQTFADYVVPEARQAPLVETLILEDHLSPSNPLGIKGVGRAGIVGMGAAVAAAVDDALGEPGFVTALPISAGAVRALLREREAAAATNDVAAPADDETRLF